MISPEKIYLQVDHKGQSATDWFDGVTWCQDKINSNDVEYIRADLASAIEPPIQDLSHEIQFNDGMDD